MPGIYIHIPFCKQKCHYCNFFSSASLRKRDDLIEALKMEIVLQKDWLTGEHVKSIYLGGGTPSLLTTSELDEILNLLSKYYSIDPDVEITLEANPDDISRSYLNDLKITGINRLSLGIQSFSDKDLIYLNRVHNAFQVFKSLFQIKESGIENISIDLIYGIPTQNDKSWILNLETVFDFKIPHISAYALTVEPKTALDVLIKRGKYENVDDTKIVSQFHHLCNMMDQNRYLHYEISNFCKDGYFSKHNMSYWSGEKYLGLGPSAHSFDGSSRQWNVSSISEYIQSILSGKLPYQKEILTPDQKYNEYVMTSLRTMWGTDLMYIKNVLGSKYYDHSIKEAEKHIQSKYIIIRENRVLLTTDGKLLTDKISSDLFI